MTTEYTLAEFPGYPPGQVRPVMRPEGSGRSGIMVVGEALGEHEEIDRLPFRPHAEAGSVLERALHRAGIPREALTLANVVWYRPPRNWLDGAPWEEDAIHVSRPLLDALIRERKPKVILALGGVAMRELTGLSGDKAGIMMTRGFLVPALTYRERFVPGPPTEELFDGEIVRDPVPALMPGGKPIPIVGSLHPSFLRRGSKDRQDEGPKGKVLAAGGGTQGMALLGVLIRDLQLVQAVALGQVRAFTWDDYRLGASLDDWENLARQVHDDPGAVVSYDFETQDSLQVQDESESTSTIREVTQVQVSLRPGQALVSTWTPELLPALKALIESPGTKLDWNGRKFDRPILRAMGIRTDLGRWVDGMDYWHHAQPDLPRGLQFATSFFCPEAGPWKHKAIAEPLWYGALDVDMPRRVYDGLKSTLSLVRHPVSGVSLETGHEMQVVDVAPVLDRMTSRGIPVDEARRLALDAEFTSTLSTLSAQMQGLYPRELRDLSPKLGYVRSPDEVLTVCSVCGGKKKLPNPTGKGSHPCVICGGKGKVEMDGLAQRDKYVDDAGSEWVKREFTGEVKCTCAWSKPARKVVEIPPNCAECNNTGKRLNRVARWAKLLPFLPGSPVQVLRYIKARRADDLRVLQEKWFARHTEILDPHQKMDEAALYASARTAWKIPNDHKTGRETTGEAELRRLAEKTGDPLLPKVLEFREIAKMRGTYVQGWAPQEIQDYPVEDESAGYPQGHVERIGRVHPGFGFKPATGQLSSENPNAQNFPAHSEIALRMNLMIRATPGKVMIKLDWKSFHLVTGAFEAQDPDALRIARVDFHSFLTLVGLLRLERPEVAFAWSSPELADRVRYYRKHGKVYPAYARRAFPAGMTFDQIRDALAKRVVYGWEFGQGPRSLYTLNQESFASESEAQVCQTALKDLFPKIVAWQRRVRLQADHDACLVSRHGFVRRFWDVFHRKPIADNYQPRNGQEIWVNAKTGQKWLLTPGDDHEAVVAFLPANDAFGIKRLALAELGARDWDEEFGLISETHDDFRFECRSSLVDSALVCVRNLMETPSKVLVDPVVAPDGLWCAVEAKQGPSWAEMTQAHVDLEVRS